MDSPQSGITVEDTAARANPVRDRRSGFRGLAANAARRQFADTIVAEYRRFSARYL
jgi:hypothetical protein